MKNFSIRRFAALTMCACVLACAAAVSAQQPVAPVKIKFERGAAVTDGGRGALVEWQTDNEAGNLGFFVYRAGAAGERVLLNRQIIRGSAFAAGEFGALDGRRGYAWFDADGAAGSQYIVQAIDVTGAAHEFRVKTQLDRRWRTRLGKIKTLNAEADKNDATTTREFPAVAAAAPRMNGATSEEDFAQQLKIASQPGVRIGVCQTNTNKPQCKGEGIYRVTRQQLADAGFDVFAPVDEWNLYADGAEQALLVTGAENGVLGANGFIEFYGRALDTTYSDTRVYYLVRGGAGRRMPTVKPPVYATVGRDTGFAATVERKTRIIYLSSFLNGEAENFFGNIFLSSPVNFTLNAPSVDRTDSAAEAVVEVSIQGFSNVPNHQTRVSLNGTLLGTVEGGAQAVTRRSFTVPASLVAEGANTITLQTAASNDSNLLDYLRITYPRAYTAANNRLAFTTEPGVPVAVDNFTDPNVRVFNVTDPANVSLVARRVETAGATFTANVRTQKAQTLIAATETATFAPAFVNGRAGSRVHEAARGKDMLIVSYKDWLTEANALAAHRRSQGLTVEVLDVDNVFDEFSFGANTPQAVSRLVAAAAPRYTLLFGDATLDTHSYISARINYVPFKITDTAFGEVVSDELLADADNDFVAETAIGRLPARSAAEAAAMVNKIIRFEQLLGANPYNRGVLFIADNPDSSTVNNFPASNQSLALELPAGTPTAVISRQEHNPATITADIRAQINAGKYIVGYAGHGATTSWGNGSAIFGTADVNALTNTDNLSLFLLLTCLNGAFANHSGESLSETMIKQPNGAASAVWSSSGLTVAAGQDEMGRAFYSGLRQAPTGARFGDLARAAKLSTFDADVRASWIALADPAMRVK